jgi:tetratricopeptide (TPR) repeat protein
MPARRSIVAVWAVAFLFSLPARATAQKYAFLDAFIEFHSALPGTYGDEGPRVIAALDRMATSLDSWEQLNRNAEEALRARPGTTPADVALLEIDRWRLDDALDAMDRAITINPRRASYYVLRGLLLHKTGQTKRAGADFDVAHALDPADSIAAYLLAAHLAEEGGSDRLAPLVATLLATAEQGAPPATTPFPKLALVDDLSAKVPVFSPPVYADGFASFAAGRFREAIERFRATAERDPLVIDEAGRNPHVRAGIRALREGQGREAIAELEAATSALPTSPEAHRVLGVAYRAVGRLAESIAQFETAVRLGRGVAEVQRPRIALGTTLMEAGRLEDAERVLRDTVATFPASGDARWALAQVYERLDRATDAVAILEATMPLTVIAGQSHLYWRIAELAHGYWRDNDRVIAMLSKRTRLLLNVPETHKDLGMAYYRAGRADEALAELLMATLLHYEDAEMFGAMGQIHLAAGRLALAATITRRAVVLDPNLAQARYVLGSTLRRLGQLDQATEQLNAFQRLQAAKFEAQRRGFEIDATVQRARQLARAGRLVEAATAYERAGTLGAPADIYRELAAIYAKLGRASDRARALARAEAR